MKRAFVFSDDFLRYDYGPRHPLKVMRLKHARDLMQACGLLEGPDVLLPTAKPCTRQDLLRFHTGAYVQVLEIANDGQPFAGMERYGIGPGDNPLFPGVYDWSRLVVGASLEAARLVAAGEAQIAFSMAGGLHHAQRARASGFCYVNDPVLAMQWLLDRGFRVAYVDIDVHHGDGVQWAFYDTDQVLTISLHQDGRSLFPGTGGVEEMGRGAGTGFSVNVPLWPGTDDGLFLRAFDEVVVPIVEAFSPDIVVTQLGVDTFHDDPLAMLDLTIQGFVRVVERMKDMFQKWVALGGGGYELANVARAWTLAWGLMNGRIHGDEIPSLFQGVLRRMGYGQLQSRDDCWRPSPRRQVAEDVLEYVLGKIRKVIFPIYGL